MKLLDRLIGYRDGKTWWWRLYFPHYQQVREYHDIHKMNYFLAVCRWTYFLIRGLCGFCEGKSLIFYTTSNKEFEIKCPACKGTFKRGNFLNEFGI